MDPEAFVAHLPLCRALPKLELHAHLNGSIRSSTLLELAAEHSQSGAVSYPELVSIIEKEKRSLPETFKLFGLIRLVTTNHQVVTRITREVRLLDTIKAVYNAGDYCVIQTLKARHVGY
jgi:adenosine deaminase